MYCLRRDLSRVIKDLCISIIHTFFTSCLGNANNVEIIESMVQSLAASKLHLKIASVKDDSISVISGKLLCCPPYKKQWQYNCNVHVSIFSDQVKL